jgi:hypothetical protein
LRTVTSTISSRAQGASLLCGTGRADVGGAGAVRRERDQGLSRRDGRANPEKADPGPIRKEFALNIGENSVHGSARRKPKRRKSRNGLRATKSLADLSGKISILCWGTLSSAFLFVSARFAAVQQINKMLFT